jgi:signal transduction histidine kinase
LFKTRRLKNGLPSLKKHGTNDIGMYLSISLMLAGSSFSLGHQIEIIYIVLSLVILFCGISILFWWRHRLTRKYLEDVKAREMDALQKTILEKDEEISQLQQHNEELAKIIHKDNKLIPAMELAVRELLASSENEAGDRQAAKGMALLAQLESISRERAGIIKSYEATSKRLQPTGVLSIDALMTYMHQKAKSLDIDLDLSVSGSVRYLITHVIEEADANTLLADLLDNAIIATKRREKKNILSTVGICDHFYRIDVFDSGIPFTPETIAAAGLEKTTTHQADGGSGIGLMTVFQILEKYQASFEIDECLNNSLFTKRVSVCFDALGQFRVKTNRAAPDFTAGRSDIIFSREAEPI